MRKIIFLFVVFFFAAMPLATAQQPGNDSAVPEKQDENNGKPSGVAVSPSTLKFNVKPGTAQVKEIKITNDSRKTYKFRVAFHDFTMNTVGKPLAPRPEESKYALSKWLSVSPSYLELKPGESQKLKVNVNVPNEEGANIAAWTMLIIDEVVERPPLDIKGNQQTMAFGVNPSIGFGVYVYQNPPNVAVNKVEITNLKMDQKDNKRSLSLEVKNTGDGIGFCTAYIELTNLTTGKQERLQVKKFTILPGFNREFIYELPAGLAPGKYSAAGVVDYGSKEEIQAGELEFTIP